MIYNDDKPFCLVGMMKFTVALLLLFPMQSVADYGFTYQGDLNGDGVDDYIYSGPSGQFGNGGGPCLIKVSIAADEYKQKVVHCGNSEGLILDPGSKYKPARIWGYSHFTAGTGSIYTLTLDGEFIQQTLWVYPGATGDSENIDSQILKVITEKGQLIKFEQIENNYMPPELDCEWGKDC